MTTVTLFIIAAGLAQQPQWVVPAGFHVTVFADSVEIGHYAAAIREKLLAFCG